MRKNLLRYSFGWGFVLWFIGYVLGIVFFPILPTSLIGWVIMPIGILITLWVLFRKIPTMRFNDYVIMAVVWTCIAVVCDYFLLVKVFKPEDGYYKLDVYLYYLFTLGLPLFVGFSRIRVW